MKNKVLLLMVFILWSAQSFSQRVLVSWNQNFIEDYTSEMYEAAQKLTSTELLSRNLSDNTWSAVFLTVNASINHHAKDVNYLKALANQIPDNKVTRLEGTSRLIIWERIISGDIVFEGKGLVIDNDLYQVSGRANQILQSLTGKNFGFVTINSNKSELTDLKNKWLTFLDGKPIEEERHVEYKNAQIPEIAGLAAVQALIVSLQDNPKKLQITKDCLKRLYHLDEMPKERGSSASYCSPDTYAFSYLGMLFGEKKFDETKDALWWKAFWEANHSKLKWNDDKGIYEVSK